MTERSFYWSNATTGDGSISPYDDDEFSDIWRKLFMKDRTSQGYIEGYGELFVSNPSGNTIRVNDGAALVDGKFYENDANVDNAIATPAVATRYDRVVLRKSWAAQTVRVVILTGIEGGGVPALTQNDGVTWEIPLATVEITTAPIITITDERAAVRSPMATPLIGSMIEIESIVARGSDDPTIDFFDIPPEYTHLMVFGQGRMTGSILEANLQIRLNEDAGANYQIQRFRGEDFAAAAFAAAAQTSWHVGEIPAANGSSFHTSILELLIPNYRNTSFFKTFLASSLHMPNSTTANFSLEYSGGLWSDVSSVRSITLLSTTGGAGNFVDESVYTLYGII